MVPSSRLAAIARDCGFELVGFARAEPIPPALLEEWIAAGHHADLDWMASQVAQRLDVTRLLPGAKTVMALACNAWRPGDSLVARYARGRDYHLTLRDRIRALRRTFRAEFPGVSDYGSVDANPVMEKVWASRAGLGYVGKNGCLITPEYGSWVLLAAMIFDVEVDAYSAASPDDCGKCRLCLDACPTQAIVADRVVDARRCLSYQTIENEEAVPQALRPELRDTVFGCDVCQDVCPLNSRPVPAGERFAPRAVANVSARELAGMTAEQYALWVPGTPLARAGFDGLRRNAAYVLGATRDYGAREVLERLAGDPSAVVQDAARWALAQFG